MTGYYEPEINVSLRKTKKFNVPILRYNKYYAKFDRRKIESSFKMKDVLLWTDSKIELFFLQIQGSGIGSLGGGKKLKLIMEEITKKSIHLLENF